MIYNRATTRGPIAELYLVAEVEKTLMVMAFAASWSGSRRSSACCRRSTAASSTGASASVKGYAQSAPFAMGKFALRGLSESMARELHPKGIHVAHVVIDGGIES